MNYFSTRIKVSALGLLIVLYSCRSVDLKPQGSLSSDQEITSSVSNMESLLIGVYNSLGEQHGNAQGENFYSSPTNWQFDVVSDDAYKGSNTGDQAPLLELEEFKYNSVNPYLDRRWKVLYEGVTRANNFIRLAKLSTVFADDVKTRKIAEARFLRGHFYFQLYRTFRFVPWIDETVTDPLTPNNVDIMPQIIEDFKFAKGNLPTEKAEIGRPDKYSATAYLGKAYLYLAGYTATNYTANLKADGSNFSGNDGGYFQRAYDELNEVKNNGGFALMPQFIDIYDPRIKLQNTEVIFSVQNSINDGAPAGEHGDLGFMLNNILNGPGGLDTNGCCGFYVPSESLANAYKTSDGLPIDAFTGKSANAYNDDSKTGGNMSDFGLKSYDSETRSGDPFTPYAGEVDPRLDYTIGRRGIPFLDYGLHPGQNWSRSPVDQGNYSRKKRYISKSLFGGGYGIVPTNFTFTSIDFHIIRYDDVLLMLAECAVELGKLQEAQVLVDQIRARAKSSTYQKTEVKNPTNGKIEQVNSANYKIELYGSGNPAFSDKVKARNAVRFERRLEMAFEGSRFFDLVRWGIAEDVINNGYAPNEPVSYKSNIRFVSGKNEFFTIPQNQIDLSTKNGSNTLKQNKGY